MAKTMSIEAKLPQDLFSEVKERVRLGLYTDESEVISAALKRAFAEESREFLRGLAKSMKLSKSDMIKEWQNLRK